MEPVLLRPEQAAEVMSISRSVVYELMRRGELASLKIGRSRRITMDAIREFVARQERVDVR